MNPTHLGVNLVGKLRGVVDLGLKRGVKGPSLETGVSCVLKIQQTMAQQTLGFIFGNLFNYIQSCLFLKCYHFWKVFSPYILVHAR